MVFLYISCVRGELWRRKNLFPAFAAPATEARQDAVNTGKRMADEFSHLWTVHIKDVYITVPVRFIKRLIGLEVKNRKPY